MKNRIKLSTLRGQYQRDGLLEFGFASEQPLPPGARLRLDIFYMAERLYSVCVEPARRISLEIPAGCIPDGCNGFGISCRLESGGAGLAECSTAFDYRDEGRGHVRYGFLSDFSPADRGKAQDSLDFLAEFHMTHIQFYDWTYRHHRYEGPSDVYCDTMGKEIDFTFVQKQIKGCRERGMEAVGYGAVYAAGEEYLREHPEQSLTDYSGEAHNLIDRFFIMDIRPGSGWRTQLMKQYRWAVQEAGFDGIHMDTYGYPKRAFASDGEQRKLVYLEDDFPGLIDQTRTELGDDAVLIFNNVGNWPVHATAPAGQDAVYIEVWEPYDSYSHIRQIILDALPYGKPVVLAAYLAPFRLEENHGGNRALNAALILHGLISSLGASHLLLGEGAAALTQGYYNDYSPLRTDEIERLKQYYDFQLRYRDIFLDSELLEISETHTAGENREYYFTGAAVSADGRPGTVWTLVRESRGRKVISLINLCAQSDSFWNRGKNDLRAVGRFAIQMPDDGEITSVFEASPDDGGTANELSYHRTLNERGGAVSIELVDLRLWTIVVVDYIEQKSRC